MHARDRDRSDRLLLDHGVTLRPSTRVGRDGRA
jgi:hypothetical protein